MNSPTSLSSNLYTEVYGNGDPILCLHGLGSNIFTWRHFIGPFSTNNKLILIDLKGFGKSPKPEDTFYSIEDHAESVYQLIIKENLTRLTLIGNSFGGGVALLLAIKLCEQKPGRLSKLILIDSGGHKEYLPGYLKLVRSKLGGPLIHLLPSRLAVRFVLRACYYNKSKITKEQLPAYANPLASPGGRNGFLQTAKQCIPPGIDELIARLRTITVPTLILWGRQDRILPLKIGELLHQAIPNSTLEVIEECGHIPHEEKPKETIATISRFLAATS
ncbi:MAG TPA: hypothetical protein DCK93_10160 [Blastocatellia bacterium]|nr:hypothetical protein [Blastocatellia bacterium]HAF23253.1 hypothetical protein [Blastocatellia bacterium]